MILRRRFGADHSFDLVQVDGTDLRGFVRIFLIHGELRKMPGAVDVIGAECKINLAAVHATRFETV